MNNTDNQLNFPFIIFLVVMIIALIWAISVSSNNHNIINMYEKNPTNIVCRDYYGNSIRIDKTWFITKNDIDGYQFVKIGKKPIDFNNCAIIIK